jgi:hypothetical protein
MRKLLGTALVVAGTVVPGVAAAQMGHDMGGMPKHEFGVDVFAAYQKPSGGSGGLLVATPVDVRVGFVSSGSMMFETRSSFSFASGGGTFIGFNPGVNVLFRIGQGTGNHNLMGRYFTVGADINVQSFKITGLPSASGAVIAINGGVGTRMAYGSAATRIELFGRYLLKNTKLGSPNTLQVGARLGLSLWH